MSPNPAPPDLLDDLRKIINRGQAGMAGAFRQGLVLTYWQVGARIQRDILGNERADYGQEIVATLSPELSWSHFVLLLPLQDTLKRDFYIEMSRRERWDVRTTRDRIEGTLLATESRRRNEQLAQVFQRVGLTERSAIGVKRMYRAMLPAIGSSLAHSNHRMPIHPIAVRPRRFTSRLRNG